MWKKFKKWCRSNTTAAKFTRTVAQGIIGVGIAYTADVVASFQLDPLAQTVIVASVMAVLAPAQAAFGNKAKED